MKIWIASFSIFFVVILFAIYFKASTSALALDQYSLSPYEEVENERIYLPIIVRAAPQSQSLLNGDFEEGLLHWGEYSLQGWATILPSEFLPVDPHSGNWAVWLGGAPDEVNGVWQKFRIPSSRPILAFHYWIASEDLCGFDLALVTVDLDAVVDSFWLCYDNNTSGWVRRTVDLTAYAGQLIELDILAGTDDILNSNLFIDDVSLTGSTVALDVIGDIQGVDISRSSVKSFMHVPVELDRNRSVRVRNSSDLLENYQDEGSQTRD